jgi:hypothetical protein
MMPQRPVQRGCGNQERDFASRKTVMLHRGKISRYEKVVSVLRNERCKPLIRMKKKTHLL